MEIGEQHEDVKRVISIKLTEKKKEKKNGLRINGKDVFGIVPKFTEFSN